MIKKEIDWEVPGVQKPKATQAQRINDDTHPAEGKSPTQPATQDLAQKDVPPHLRSAPLRDFVLHLRLPLRSVPGLRATMQLATYFPSLTPKSSANAKPTANSTNGNPNTWGCMSPSRKLKKGNSSIISTAFPSRSRSVMTRLARHHQKNAPA